MTQGRYSPTMLARRHDDARKSDTHADEIDDAQPMTYDYARHIAATRRKNGAPGWRTVRLPEHHAAGNPIGERRRLQAREAGYNAGAVGEWVDLAALPCACPLCAAAAVWGWAHGRVYYETQVMR